MATASQVSQTDDEGHRRQSKKGGGILDGADRRDTGGENIIHHDGGHRHKRNHWTQDQVGKRIDPAADQVMLFQDLGNLHQTGAEKANQQRGQGDEDDGAEADETVRFGRSVKDRGKFVHQGDDGHGEPGEPDSPLLGE